jgi:hypothetical protein
MYARDQKKVYSRSKTGKISAAQTQKILSRIPRDKASLIHDLGADWKDIESGIVSVVRIALEVSIRALGHGAITANLTDLIERPDRYSEIAHQRYIESVTTEQFRILDADQIRQLFPSVEMTDESLHGILRKASEAVLRTPDEPKLVVVHAQPTDANREYADMFVTFAH